MKKIHFTLVLIFSVLFCYSQNQEFTSEQFIVSGKVKKEITFKIVDLQQFPSKELKNINTSCSPKKESIAQSVRVVLLKDVLDTVEFDSDKPKSLGQFYFLFVSVDGYKIVFSFNEIYNTEVGDNLYLVTELEGKKLSEMDERIMLLCTKDKKPGSRNIKGLSKIIVGKAE